MTSDGIRADCAAEWPGDYRMQRHCIDRQNEAGRMLAPLFRSAAGEQRRILEKCASEWTTRNGFDLRMVKHCYERQMEAYEALKPAPSPPKPKAEPTWCHPTDNTARVLSSANANDVHPDWRGESYLGMAWAMQPKRRAEKNGVVYYSGDLYSPRGGLVNPGVFVLAREWECDRAVR